MSMEALAEKIPGEVIRKVAMGAMGAHPQEGEGLVAETSVGRHEVVPGVEDLVEFMERVIDKLIF